MAADSRPANDDAPPSPSLVDRLLAAARRKKTRRPQPPRPVPEPGMPVARRRAIDRIGLAMAVMIVAMPVATWIGATRIAARDRAATAQIVATAAPIEAARAGHDRARTLLTATWRGPTAGMVVEALARSLPPEAALLRVDRAPTGALSVEVAAPDPDRLMAALRREPALTALHATGQVQGDGAMRVTLETRR